MATHIILKVPHKSFKVKFPTYEADFFKSSIFEIAEGLNFKLSEEIHSLPVGEIYTEMYSWKVTKKSIDTELCLIVDTLDFEG